MQQQYPNYPNYYSTTGGMPARFNTYQPVAQPNQQPIGLKGRQVASFEEVKGIPIDFDGSVSYFPDLGNKRIYTKYITADGTPAYNVYELSTAPVETPAGNSNYITREEFDNTMAQVKGMFNQIQQQQQQVAPQNNNAPTSVAS